MTTLAGEPGSFRDPGSRIFTSAGRIYRAMNRESWLAYDAVRDSGLIDRLVASRMLLPSTEVDPQAFSPPDRTEYLLEHPALPFVSYPYEWCFTLHKKAALLHLDLQLEALAGGAALSDATAYNVQFDGSRPTFIDHGSLRPYQEGELWAGHRQFCMQFLNPLLLWSRLGIAPNNWFRGSLEGIAPEDVAPLLSLRDNLSFTVLSHVTAQAALQRRANRTGNDAGRSGERKLSRTAFKAMLEGLRRFIGGLSIPRRKTVWSDYAGDNSYGGSEAAAKHAFVRQMAEKTQPSILFDLGCNTGEYTKTALDAGAAYAVGFDYDFGALEQAVERADRTGMPFLPLWLDAANPSPSQGWNQAERKGLKERAKADALIALAFVHHLAIARNVPLGMVVDWITSMAPVGVIEFVPKADPMVQRLLANRADIFPDYDEHNFLSALGARARIVRHEHLKPGGRSLAWYDRSQ
jgi:ribosomal protein L11 methylase PrmA